MNAGPISLLVITIHRAPATAGHIIRPPKKINLRKHLIAEDQVREKKGLEILFFKSVPVFNIQVNSTGTGKRLLWVGDKTTLRFEQTICSISHLGIALEGSHLFTYHPFPGIRFW